MSKLAQSDKQSLICNCHVHIWCTVFLTNNFCKFGMEYFKAHVCLFCLIRRYRRLYHYFTGIHVYLPQIKMNFWQNDFQAKFCSHLQKKKNVERNFRIAHMFRLPYLINVHQSINTFLLKSRGMKYCPSGKIPTY